MIVVWMMWEGFGIKKEYTLFDGRSEIKDYKYISSFLESPKIDGWYHLYIVHEGDNMGEKSKDHLYIWCCICIG